jgi:hypothetical protein
MCSLPQVGDEHLTAEPGNSGRVADLLFLTLGCCSADEG